MHFRWPPRRFRLEGFAQFCGRRVGSARFEGVVQRAELLYSKPTHEKMLLKPVAFLQVNTHPTLVYDRYGFVILGEIPGQVGQYLISFSLRAWTKPDSEIEFRA
jgi:hypothetical protein